MMVRLPIWMYLYCCLVILFTSIWKVAGSHEAGCSCYSFDGQAVSTWSGAEKLCKDNKGELVSMETLGEWDFIKTQIQNKTTDDGRNEWWIGLRRDGEWTWLSNHSLAYNKWLRGQPDNSTKGKDYVVIAKEVNGTQGLFNQTGNSIERGRICEYQNTNCTLPIAGDRIPWCSPVSKKPTRNTTGSNQSNVFLPPRHPSECAVIKNPDTRSVIIPTIVAVVGLLVIVAINIIVIKWRRAAKKSLKKIHRPSSHSRLEDTLPDEGHTITMDVHGSGIDQNIENYQPSQEYGCSSVANPEGDVNNDAIDINESDTANQEQPYYVNIQGRNEDSMPKNTLPATGTGTYALANDINETDGHKDAFVVVRTYSLVHTGDTGHTDNCMASTYATVNDSLQTDGQTTALMIAESEYACVDVISQRGPSGHDRESTTSTNGLPYAETPIQYTEVEMNKTTSKKIKNKEPEDQNNTDLGYVPAEVIYDNCVNVPPFQDQERLSRNKANTKHTLANNARVQVEFAAVDNSTKKRNKGVKEAAENIKPTLANKVPNAGVRVEYAAIDKSMKKRNRSVREATASVANTQQNLAGKEPNAEVQAEYAAVCKSMKKRNRSVKEETASVANTQQSLASKEPNAEVQAEYAAVDKSMKKRNRSVKEAAENTQQTLTNKLPNAGVRVEYAAINKSMKKRNRSVKEEAAKPSKCSEASYASVNVIYDNCQDDLTVSGEYRTSRLDKAE